MTLKERIDTFFLRNIRERDTGSAGGLKAFQLKLLQLLYVIVRELSGEQLALRAMGLVYTTLLSLVPLLAVSFSVLKAFGVHARLEILLYYFLEPLGPQGTDIAIKVIDFVEKVNVGVLGSVGLATLIYTVISQVQKIERAFNYIWKVKGTRSLAMRFSNYTSVLLVGPVLIFSVAGFTASLTSTAFVHALQKIEPFGTLLSYAGKLLPSALVCAAFAFLYYSLPNTKVRFGSALVGGLVAGLSWMATGLIFTSFIVSSAQYSAIYSGFAVLILFLIWLYWSFLILLLGASVSFHHQNPQFIAAREENSSLSPRLLEKLAMSIIWLIGSSFHEGRQPWKINTLSERLRLPTGPVQDVITVLEKKGLIIASGDEPPAYLPARDLEAITLKEVADAVRTSGENNGAGAEVVPLIPEIDSIMKKIEEGIAGSLENATVRTLLLSHRQDD
jgi:membrane protein